MTITKRVLGTLTALCLSLAGGCDDAKDAKKDAKVEAKADGKAEAKGAETKTDGKVEAKGAEAKADAAVDAKGADTKADAIAPEAGAAGDAPAKIGVAECDEYVTKMSACIASGSVPADQLEAQKMGLDMYQKSWADAVKTNPADSATLVPGCKAAIEMGKVSHPGCFK